MSVIYKALTPQEQRDLLIELLKTDEREHLRLTAGGGPIQPQGSVDENPNAGRIAALEKRIKALQAELAKLDPEA